MMQPNHDSDLDPLDTPALASTSAALGNIETTIPADATEKALRWLGTAFAPDQVIELTTLAQGRKSIFGRLGNPEERKSLGQFIEDRNGRENIYFGVNPRIMECLQRTSPAKTHDVAVRHLAFFDHDLPPHIRRDSIEARKWREEVLAAHMPVKPNFVNGSGSGGVHVFYRLANSAGNADTNRLNSAAFAVGSDGVGDLARIARLPFTLNVPTKKKRDYGRTNGLAALCYADIDQPPRNTIQLCLELESRGTLAAAGQHHVNGGALVISKPANANLNTPEPAPTWEILSDIIDLIPNGDTFGREHMIRVFQGIRGAALGQHFESDARIKAFEWAAQYAGSDPDHDAKAYDGMQNPGVGLPLLTRVVHELNPQQSRAIACRLAAHAFADAVIDPSQQHLVGASPQDLVRKFEEPEGATIPERAVNALRANGALFFQDESHNAFVDWNGEVYAVDSDLALTLLLARLSKLGVVVLGTSKVSVQTLLKYEALTSDVHEVHCRIATKLVGLVETTFIDMADDKNNLVVVQNGGWRIEQRTSAHPKFARRPGMWALPHPLPLALARDFLTLIERHINIPTTGASSDAADVGVQARAALLMFCLSNLRRKGSVPHLALLGAQGSGKTVAAGRLKQLLDPDEAITIPTLPNDERELFNVVQGQTVMVVDNISRLKDAVADVMCTLADGTAYAGRKLYSSDRQVIRSKTALVVTSIDRDLVKRQDLLDRTLLLELPTLSGVRKSKTQMDMLWDADLPDTFGALLDLLARAMVELANVEKSVKQARLPRLADAALLAEAGARVLGWPDWLCLDAIWNMREGAAGQQLADDPLAARIRSLLAPIPNRTWTGKISDLQTEVWKLDGPGWGNASASVQALTSRLGRIEGALREAWSIEVERGPRTKVAGKLITLRMKG